MTGGPCLDGPAEAGEGCVRRAGLASKGLANWRDRYCTSDTGRAGCVFDLGETLGSSEAPSQRRAESYHLRIGVPKHASRVTTGANRLLAWLRCLLSRLLHTSTSPEQATFEPGWPSPVWSEIPCTHYPISRESIDVIQDSSKVPAEPNVLLEISSQAYCAR